MLLVILQLYREGKIIASILLKQLGTLHSCLCVAAFHLGTIDEPHEGCPVEAETEDGEWWTRLEDGWMDPDVHDPKEGTCQASII